MIPIIDQGKKPVGGYTDDSKYLYRGELPVILFGDHTRNFKFCEVRFCIGADGVKVLRARDGFDSKYLYHFLNAQEISESGYSRHFKFLKEIDVVQPPIETQRLISVVLNHVESLRTKRREAIALLDDLTQSIFLDMFGDPVTNERNWDRTSFSDVLERIDSGSSPQCLTRPAESNEWGVLKLGAVTRCVYDPRENKALPSDVLPVTKNEVRTGDLLFSRKNTRELVAACALVNETPQRLLMPDLIFRLVLKSDAVVDKVYLHRLLTHPRKRRQVQNLSSGSAGSMPNIPKSKLVNLEIEIPPLVIQRQFAERMKAIESTRTHHLAHLAHLDDLFASVQDRAFKGELWNDVAT